MSARTIAPRMLVTSAWLIANCVLKLTALVGIILFGRRLRAIPGVPRLLCIEAGSKGWESIEFQELAQSAREYMGPSTVLKLEIEAGRSYLFQVLRCLSKSRPTHYLYDPRTGSQHAFVGALQALAIGILLTIFGVVPIGYGTDISVRTHRMQLAVVTAARGVCVCFIELKEFRAFFPHGRVVGPSLMPFSVATLDDITSRIPDRKREAKHKVSFVGSLYEPRTSVLENVERGLEDLGIRLHIIGRQQGGPRTPDSEYWDVFIDSDISITTTAQINRLGMDFTHLKQLVYRATEALVCGSVLVIEDVGGIGEYFEDGKHLRLFKTPEDAVQVIYGLLKEGSRLEELRSSGRRRIEELIREKVFWKKIDSCLDNSLSQQTGPT